jgi:[glutamine synthetase] adenylyltransferase / [glutamine synthetase]-adenylyl-L-tyrosine phosphorylase
VTRSDADAHGSAAGFSFAETGSAARYTKILELLPARATSELPYLIADSGNPDQAVLQMDMLMQQHPSEALAAFEPSALALRACVALFGSSQWLGQTLLQNPDLLQLFARPMWLASARWAEDVREQFARFRLRFHEAALPVLLARFKRREYVRIFTRELLGLASLAEITAEISALSDVLIEEALSHCESELRRRYQGWPQLRSGQGRVYPARFSVLSLGKLGGNELNYSSDIDLLYLCDDAEDAGAISVSAREFFTRLAQELTTVLSNMSVDGQVFRVDLRLRPQGASGEMVVGCAQALRYYRNVAQDWELQALLKLRLSAGDRSLAREFVDQVQEQIYCEQLSLSTIQTAAHSLERIQRGVVRHGLRELDVKNGAGGLRELEFVVQCLQRVHGGGEPWLRSSGTLSALQKLYDKGHIGDAEFRELFETYGLLRAMEHRLQCRQGVQSHRIPAAANEQAALFRSLGDGTIRSAQELKRIMSSASDLCARVLRLGSQEGTGEVTAHSVKLGSPGAEHLIRELAARSELLTKALAADVGDPALRNLRRFLAAASTGEERLRVTLENVEWVERALPVFAQSELATDILTRHPEDIVALFRKCEREAGNSLADQLRVESRRCSLRCVGRSLLEEIPVWDILREHSRSFDTILQEALSTAEAPEGFAVFAVGRLGTCELDVVSDADLVFLRSAGCNSEDAERCALFLVSTLSGYTRQGSVIAVDTRLRPHGNEGELVASSRQLAQYFEGEAKAWETLAFGKLRLIAGTESLAEDASESLLSLRKRFAVTPDFVPQLRAMRKRLANSVGAESFKTGPGGLYDLDFLVGLLETRNALPATGKQLPERLEALIRRELLSLAQGSGLLRAVELFRRVDHAFRVVEGRSRTWLPESDVLRASVERIVGCSELDLVLRAEMRDVRSIFKSFFGD